MDLARGQHGPAAVGKVTRMIELVRRRHRAGDRPQLLTKAQPLDIGEEERPIFHERTTKAPAVLILGQRRLWKAGALREEVVAVETIVVMELEHRPAKLVGAGLGDDVDHSALCTAHFRREDVCAHLDFGNPLNGRTHAEEAGIHRVVEAIQQHLVGALGLAVGRKRGALAARIRTAAAGKAVRRTDVDSRLQPNQLDVVAANRR